MKHKKGNFRGQRGFNLYYQFWLPNESIKAVLLVAHGLAEHSGRYQNLVDYFVPRGYAVYSFDYQGHGKSEGLRCYVDRFSEYVADLKTFFDMVRKENPQTKIFIIGHSVGATTAVSYAVKHQKELDGLITSGASLVASPTVSPALLTIAGIISALLPKTGVTIIDASTISSDQAVVNTYINDPLVYRGKICARTGAELANMWKILPEQMPQLKLPTLIMHGAADRLADPSGSKLLYEQIGSEDKTLKLYQGFYHEIFNEPEYKQVMADMEAWLSKHL